MQKDFELDIDGQARHFSARTGRARDVGIFEAGAATPCVVLTENNGLERALDALVDRDELLSIAVLQAIRNGLIERAVRSGKLVQESLIFVPNPD